MRRFSRRRLLVGLLVAWPLVAWLAARALLIPSDCSRSDAIAVLAGASAYRERTALAAALFAEGGGRLVLLTNDGERGGWSVRERRNPFFVERATTALEVGGVPRDRIVVLPGTVHGTDEEAALLEHYARAHRTGSLLVVTSGYHGRRARWLLRRSFAGSATRVRVCTVPPGRQMPGPASWWLHAAGWRGVAGEYVKALGFALRPHSLRGGTRGRG